MLFKCNSRLPLLQEGVEDGDGAMRATRSSTRREEKIRVLSMARYHQ